MRSIKVVKHFYNCKLIITKNIISIGNLLIQVYKKYYWIIKARLALDGRTRFLFTLPYRVWSSILIVHEKRFFLLLFFQNISKTAATTLIKKIGQNHGISVYKKVLISEHRKNYIFRDNSCFAKMSVSLLVCTLPNFCGRANSKTSVNIKTKFHM